MATDTWESYALPILEAVAVREEAQGGILDVTDVDASLDPARVSVEMRRLVAAGYVGGKVDGTSVGPAGDFIIDPHLLERGARTVGRWPSSDPFHALVQYLEHEAAETDDPGRKAALKKVAGTLGEVGQGVLTGVLTSYLKAMTGMP